MISVCMNYEHLILITYQNTLTHRYNSKGRTYSEKIEGAITNGQILKKSSPLKPHSQMNRNLVGSFSGRSSIKIAHFV